MMIDKTRTSTVYLYSIPRVQVCEMTGISEAMAAPSQ
jgi:hypothetical protein